MTSTMNGLATTSPTLPAIRGIQSHDVNVAGSGLKSSSSHDASMTSSTAPSTPADASPAIPQAPLVETADGRLEPTDELMAELKAWSEYFEQSTPEEILRWAVHRFGSRLTMGTAFGPEGMVILYWLSQIDPQTHVFNLDTGYQFAETLTLRDQVASRYGIEVEMLRPDTTVEQYEAQHGGPLYKTDPNQCCFDRKIRVLQGAVIGRHAWISAIRRDQSADRKRADIVGWDKKFGLVKVNPLANWTKGKVWDLIVSQNIPYNPLHDRGYQSIGCWPCTRATLFGEDERAGRWSGFAKTECGLHSSE